MDNVKKQLLENYLKQQQTIYNGSNEQVRSPQLSPRRAEKSNNDILREYSQKSTPTEPDLSLVVSDVSENITLEKFKNYVKQWLDIDTSLKKIKELVKEKKKKQIVLSEIITKFMCKYNIEDLNTKEGRIRCKITQAKIPVNQKMVKERLIDNLNHICLDKKRMKL